MKKIYKTHSKFVPDFDSSSSMLFSLGAYLSGSGEASGDTAKLPAFVGDVINATPQTVREIIYRLSGIHDSLNLSNLKSINDAALSHWITDCYPKKKSPAIMIGSSNGALTHLCAMCEIPWIPQTVLLAIARQISPDDLIGDAEFGKKVATILKKQIPLMRAYQMHDPIQDRMMVANIAYFRMKRIRLGDTIGEYVKQTLMPGGTIIISNCEYTWPAARMGDDHTFQTGGLGDVSGEEYANGSDRIATFLEKENAECRKWQLPGDLEMVPEAEWGFDSELLTGLISFAKENDFRVKRISYRHPEHVSPLIADLTEHWYKQNGISDRRLLIECFALLEPWWAARTGSIPFWMAFNTSHSFERVINYLDKRNAFDEIYIMIMSNAVEGVGIVSTEEWKRVLKRAQKKNGLIGMDAEKHPYDLGSFIKYHDALQKEISARHFIPGKLDINDALEFLMTHCKECETTIEDIV